mmetsp:Transcript_50310/g.81550  ORF Transcript_50310/g.81550 Transcript_50310/m.81550 type:complete len:269 (-) Transcript_50310:439-1245(-)
MDSLQCLTYRLLLHNYRHVSLRGALCDGANVDTGTRKSAEELGCTAWCVPEPVTDRYQNGEAYAIADTVNVPSCQLQLKGLLHRFCGSLAFGLVHCHGDGVLGRGLRHKNYLDICSIQSSHHALDNFGHASPRSAFHVDERNVLDRSKCLHRSHVTASRPILAFPPVDRVDIFLLVMTNAATGDECALEGRVEDVSDEDWGVVVHAGDHGQRMQNLSAEVGQLNSLVIVHLHDGRRLRYKTWVGGEDTVNVLPQGYTRRTEQAGENSG